MTEKERSLQDLDKAKAAFDRNVEGILDYIHDITQYYSIFSVGPEKKFKKLINYSTEIKFRKIQNLIEEAKEETLRQYKHLKQY